ncbi:MAG: RagB/SusD family nutrient uptake outer membrane protein [Bacteroidales bacterium]|nr:RagB/SusD family nutrient uptake outer membrane protein [Bacteroidales bacterium]
MRKIFNLLTILTVVVAITGCDGFLDRPTKTALTDENYWNNPDNIRLFVNGGYNYYFTGYNSGWSGTKATSVFGDKEISDDVTTSGVQSDILTVTPKDNWYRAEGIYWLARRGGAPWNFAWVRKWNTLIERIEARKDIYPVAVYNHWMGVARFFRAWEYSKLVQSFGDVPYYDAVVKDNDKDNQFKARDPRSYVMQKCMEDFDFAVANIKADDGVDYLNKYVAATIASRCMLFEGTWYIYHKNDQAMQTNTNIDGLAKTFLEKARDYAEVVMNSGKYKFDTDFNSLFASESKPGNEILLYRTYSSALSVRHCTASYSNLYEGPGNFGNLSTLKAWLCADGQPYTSSTVENADSFNMKDMIASRDSRFEATFWGETTYHNYATGIYATKFCFREGPLLWDVATNSSHPHFKSNTNTNGAPCVRYAETVLNWIEAKAELADKFGGAAVTQDDLDKSINAIRNRPLAPEAIEKGVQKTAPLMIAAIPDDPARTSAAEVATHAGVVNSPLIWEIRRERRMEFFFEHVRTRDIRRWGKLELMQGATNPDILKGAWMNLEEAKEQFYPVKLTAKDAGLLKVELADGTILAYECTVNENNEIVSDNAAQMRGFVLPRNIGDRGPIGGEKQYLEPICTDVLADYKDNGYDGVMIQNPGWEGL